MAKTKIEWADQVWNPTTGCTKVSPGCKNCYAEKMHNRLRAMGQDKYQHNFGEVRTHYSALNSPLRRRKPTTYFVNSMSDLFHKDVDDLFIHEVLCTIRLTPQHTYIILTKRPQRALEFVDWMLREWDLDSWAYPDNVYLGVSVENQERADKRIPVLLEIPAKLRFVSCEPLLSAINLLPWLPHTIWDPSATQYSVGPAISWVIAGGESGPNKRPMDLEWARDLRDLCDMTRTPFFFKQIDKIQPIPDDLMIREMPR